MNDRELLAIMAASLALPGVNNEEALERAREILLALDRETAQSQYRPVSERPAPPNGDGPKMPFGKFKGWALKDLAREKPDYLRWALDNMENLHEPLRSNIQRALGL